MKHLTPNPKLGNSTDVFVKDLTDLKLMLARSAYRAGLCGWRAASATLSAAVDLIEQAQDEITEDGLASKGGK